MTTPRGGRAASPRCVGVVSCPVVSCRVVSCRVVSCRVVSCRVVSCRVVYVTRWNVRDGHACGCLLLLLLLRWFACMQEPVSRHSRTASMPAMPSGPVSILVARQPQTPSKLSREVKHS
jgi:hypothetical protein